MGERLSGSQKRKQKGREQYIGRPETEQHKTYRRKEALLYSTKEAISKAAK